MDSLSMVGMETDRHGHTDRGRHRHGHNPLATDGVGPANNTAQNMTRQSKTEQERELSDISEQYRSQTAEENKAEPVGDSLTR